MRKTHASTEYPIIIKQVKDAFVVSCPDFKQSKLIPMPEHRKITPDFLTQIAEQIGRVWLENHMKLIEIAGSNIAPPQPSQIRSVVEERTEKLLSPPELAKLAGVSADTVRRAIDRNEIKSEMTSGGHRKVRYEEALVYLEKQGYQISL